ncbi:hypothetical protein LOD99_5001 [Oopsacas minuta]|uniref:Uncharacterized protein n=1 Tax=Oopsacas minuta TaxID=111878 RepID=A0AAV7JS98_9METZ|nr:hypothetical protein LOD99_5001 [Oopsacas minuta]
MYQGSNPSNNKLGLLPAPTFGGSSKKRVRESMFPLNTPTYDIIPPSGMLPNNFPPPPSVPQPPSVRLGFNSYEQQQKRVRFNNDLNSPAIPQGYSYGNLLRNPDPFPQDYYQHNNYILQEPMNQMPQPNYYNTNQPNMQYPVTSLYNQAQQYSIMPQSSNTCSSYMLNTSHPYAYDAQLKENADPNIPKIPIIPQPLPHSSRVTPPKSNDTAPYSETRENRSHQLSRGLQLITVNPEAISRWLQLLESFNILFEIFANCIQEPVPFSLTGKVTEQPPAKLFYLKNPHSKEASNYTQLKCIYWEIENPLLPIQLDKVYRIIGSFDVKNSYLKVFDIRAAKIDEIAHWPVLVARSNRLIRKMPISQNEI